jgi:ectoine hydroxylase-related dioxygenase (phytanoyl-CoA dioxygenase family)
MLDFVDSSDLLDDPAVLRRRFDEDGYLFLRQAIDHDVLLAARRDITAAMADHGWLRLGTDPMDAITQVEPRVEGEELFFEVYDDVQRSEAFHAVPHHQSVRRVIEPLLGPDAFPHPLGIARLAFAGSGDWHTPPHQDYPNNQGTEELIACWMPTADCPLAAGPVSVLRGSHRFGVVPVDASLGAGHRRARLGERFANLDWAGGDFELGDVLVFGSLTVHQALPNDSDRMRVSVDYRFQREGAALTAGCLEPHFGRMSWGDIYAGWRRDELRYYWRNKRYVIVEWNDDLRSFPEEQFADHIREFVEWRYTHGPVEAGY